ncbi:zinc-binding alcohol dehydrogenase family protein [Levilactobacillus suantsaii]|uniref:Zinc-type alcohol dehydrogenase-like protein n=1 Tax=Levilactobacillus suantsaii TaxID=2292255 RepID=A0A4Q0VJ95_9LACO|nr:zinc-binding alcohol dehydrogenase family protein [Levilactobacillus suantsaii]RXI79607.1 zinc-binding alcohol dehydrogenase family protein [Levilactobacillus suantsaii]
MRAIGYTQHLPIDDSHSLIDFEMQRPDPTGHDLLVQVQAVSANPVDLAVRRNTEPLDPQAPKVIGFDAYGTVTAVGNAVTLFHPGDVVFYAGSFKRPGSYSEFQLVDERLVGHAPTKLTPAQSAAMPLTALTAWEALFEQLGIDPHADNHGKTILVINGAGGVGSVATQLAHWAGLTVIATASRDETIAWTRDHGSDFVVNHRQDLVPQVHDLGDQVVDYILELSNLNQHWPEIVDLIKPSGHIVSITGSDTPIDLRALKNKRATFAWEWMFTKAYFETPDMGSQHQILEQIRALLDAGTLVSTLTKTLQPINAQNVMAAHRLLNNHHMRGKLVIQN